MAVRILAVDDVESNLVALEALLQSPSVSVVRARSGKEALRALEDQDFSLVLLDVQMPEMDGFDTAAVIRQWEKTRRIPIIFLTAYGADRAKLARAYSVGASDFLSKPIDPEALRSKVAVIADLWNIVDEAKQSAETEAQRRVAEERQRWETEALRRQVADQAKATAAEHAARVEAETANRLKDEFLANLSHELRTPLNAILGWAALLRRRGAAADASTARGLAVIERNAHLQAKLIEDLLDTSRIAAGKLRLERKAVPMAELLERVVEAARPAAAQKRLRLVTTLPSDAPVIPGDPDRLAQVFTNILGNAIQFTPDGGQVEIGCRYDGAELRIWVRDSGEGITADFLPHVFDRFRQADGGATRAHGGLGIGLALAQQLVALHGGRITAHSDGPGRGATFTVALPLGASDGDAAATLDDVATDGSALAQARVLLVDDDHDARELVADLLRHAGADVTAVDSAAAALAALALARPDVIVSDIGMPRQDGYSLIRQVRTLPGCSARELPAVALTAYAGAEDVARALSAGFQAHLAKPADERQIIAAVADVLRAAGRIAAS